MANSNYLTIVDKKNLDKKGDNNKMIDKNNKYLQGQIWSFLTKRKRRGT
jgi:hypothetical protein